MADLVERLASGMEPNSPYTNKMLLVKKVEACAGTLTDINKDVVKELWNTHPEIKIFHLEYLI